MKITIEMMEAVRTGFNIDTRRNCLTIGIDKIEDYFEVERHYETMFNQAINDLENDEGFCLTIDDLFVVFAAMIDYDGDRRDYFNSKTDKSYRIVDDRRDQVAPFEIIESKFLKLDTFGDPVYSDWTFHKGYDDLIQSQQYLSKLIK